MVDISKLKRRTTLGAPPPPEEASRNLKAPEVAPIIPSIVAQVPVEPDSPVITSEGPGKETRTKEAVHRHSPVRIDGRSLRRSGRTLQLATRVSWEFDEKLRKIAQRDGLKLVEVLERGLDAYEAKKR
jgi:hypothetical protein